LLFDLTLLVLRLLRASISGSSPEIELFTQLRGPSLLLTGLLPAQPPLHLAKEALDLFSEVLNVAATEDLLLGVLDILPVSCIPLRIEIMRLLCHVLRESHRCRLHFRKCNGFVHVIQEAVRLTGHFAPQKFAAVDNSAAVTDSTSISPHLLTSESKRQLLLLVKAVIAVLTLAMTFEPASAKHFVVEMQFENLEQALRLLGCFNQKTVVDPVRTSAQLAAPGNHLEAAVDSSTVQSSDTCTSAGPQLSDALRIAFLHPELLERGHLDAMPTSKPSTPTASPTTAQRQQTAESLLEKLSGVPAVFLDICLIFRYLMTMATDSFDK
uniref:Sec7_N domain-containing protein n=1 Tax=Schistocephalus solidus TaxID=70667 RepID=A0A183TI03_SCHSO